jgi:hypothetical protein
LREVDYYRDDPLVLRLMGLRKLPDVATISRALARTGSQSVEKARILSRSLVIQGLVRGERLPRLTLDFDGSVQSTKGHTQGTAVGFNKQRKVPAVTIRCFVPLPRQTSFSMFTMVTAMCTIPMEPQISWSIAFT